jgi:hypothetical protein
MSKLVQLTGGRSYFLWESDREAARPFRLWDHQRKRNVPHRCFSTLEKARNAAIIHTAFSKVGECFEVYDCRNQKLHWQFKLRIQGSKAFVDLLSGGQLPLKRSE